MIHHYPPEEDSREISREYLAESVTLCLAARKRGLVAGGVDSHVEAISQVLESNIDSGRFEYVKEHYGDGHLTVAQYALRIIPYYLDYHPLVSRLVGRESGAWQEVWALLFRAAYHRLVEYGWDAESARERARDVTQEVCVTIHESVYPYDCDFNAWALHILQNAIKRAFVRTRDALQVPARIVGWATPEHEDLLDAATASRQTQPLLDRFDDRERLLWAIGQLSSEAQREVIIAAYFEDLSPPQIAARLKRSTTAVYNLKYQAIKKLRCILTDDE